MNRVSWDVCKKENVKDSKGKVKEQFTTIRSIRTSNLVNSNVDSIKAYGFDPKITSKVFTRDEHIQANAFIQGDMGTFHVVRVESYPRHKVLYIEEQK